MKRLYLLLSLVLISATVSIVGASMQNSIMQYGGIGLVWVFGLGTIYFTVKGNY